MPDVFVQVHAEAAAEPVVEQARGGRPHAAYHWPDIGYAKILVTPAIDGFVLAMTQGWLGWWRGGDSIARANKLDAGNAGEITMRMSEWHGAVACDEVQFFASHRRYGLCGWGRYRFTDTEYDERVFMKYLGEFVESHGAITAAERALAASIRDNWAALGFLSAEQIASRLEEERAELLGRLASGQFELVGAGHEDLGTIAALHLAIGPDRVAARWSVDTNTLEERSDIPDTCWLGELYV